MTGKQTLQNQLRLVQQAQDKCVDENGIVKCYMRFEYQELVRKAHQIKKGIEFMDTLKTSTK